MKRFHLIRWCWCLPALALAACNPDAQQTAVDDASQALPPLKAAQSLSRHYVEVVFAGEVDAAAEDASRYRITGPNNASLEVRAASRTADPDRVILTTAQQEELLYELQVVGSGDAAVAPVISAVSLAPGSILFKGSSAPEPYIASALALDNTTVLVTFNEVMDNNANVATFYRIESPDLKIISAAKGTLTTVQLTTEPMEHVQYTLKAYNISAGNGTKLIDPDNSATFQGIPPVDTGAPQLLTAAVVSDTKVLLSFSEPLADSVTDPLNFTISPSLLVTAAELSTYNTQVLLTTLPMQAGVEYTVTAGSGVHDKAGNPIDAAAGEATFTFNGQTELNGAGSLPRVVGAIALSNTSVRVTFSKAMGAGLDTAANYRITGADTAFLLVKEAVAGPNRLYVDLTTSSQAPGDYIVHVVNVLDTSGNPLMGPSGLLAPPEGVDPSSARFRAVEPIISPGPDGEWGTDDDIDEHIDTDGDKFADWFETLGWFITIKFANGTTSVAHVTSDPYSPDTDNDGLDDSVENQWSFDPRTDDTDADHLTDGDEFNVYYSDPASQDTDEDGIGDFLEVDFFKTSPLLADSDGDQLSDGVELFESSRNPLLADLPIPQITVGSIRLDLQITSSFTDEQGTTTEISDSSTTSFAQSRSDTLATSSTTSTEEENGQSQSLGFEAGVEDGGFVGNVHGDIGFEQSRSLGFSSTVDRETAKESQQSWEKTVEKALAQSQNRSVTRNIESAVIQATVNLANRGDVAFSITNLELSVLQQDRRSGLSFQPVATLRPSGDDTPTFNLGPLDGERGPIIFESTSVFPNLVEGLMREPTGLVFKVVNFDILDELGRNFAFTSQEVVERTAGIEIDFGDGVVEKYHVATTSTFDDNGLPVGITLQRALQIAGLERAAGNDPPLPPTITPAIRNSYGTIVNNSVERLTRIRGVQNDRTTPNAKKRAWAVLVSDVDVSQNANFSSINLQAGDKVQLWFTSDTDDDKLFAREEYLYGSRDDDTDTDDDGLGDFFEVRTGWLVNRLPGLPYKVFSDPARADSDLDQLTDKEEFTEGTDPHRSDTDEDGISDKFEIVGPLEVVLYDGDADETNDVIMPVNPYTTAAIIDGGNGVCNTTKAGDDVQVKAVGAGVTAGDVVIGPGPNGVIDTTPSSDDLLSTADEIVSGPDGKCNTTKTGDDIQVVAKDAAATAFTTVCIRAGKNGLIDSTPAGDDFIRVRHARLFAINPLDRDTDADGIPDGREFVVGTNPNSRDAGRVVDSDQDGLTDDEETAGWLSATTTAPITVTASNASNSTIDRTGGAANPFSAADANGAYLRFKSGNEYRIITYNSATQVVVAGNASSETDKTGVLKLIRVTSNLLRADTDLDGLGDVFERAIGSNPRLRDTDGDTLSDLQEFDPADQDNYYSDAEMEAAVRRCNDADNCSLPDAPSTALRTNITQADSDGDTINDNIELTQTWVVSATGPDGSALDDVQAKSVPYSADADGDKLTDAEELAEETDPNSADSDTDGTNDGDETTTCFDHDGSAATADVCRDPLLSDRLIEFKYTNFHTTGDCDDIGFGGAEIAGILNFSVAGTAHPGYRPSGWKETCAGETGTIATDQTLDYTRKFILAAGQSFTASSSNMNECDAGHVNNLSNFSSSFLYTTVAGYAPNTVTPASNTITGSGDVGRPCEFRIDMSIKSIVTFKP